MTLSVIIPTLNCAKELKRCLESVKWSDEIVIVDMGSIDNTLDVAKKYNARIYSRIPENGNFDKNRKFGMEKASSDWILKLDSDEKLSPELQTEIKGFLKNDSGQFDGLNLYNNIFMFRKQIKHGFVKSGSHELRLVRKDKWHYNPYRFHQLITVNGFVGFLKNTYDHYNFDSTSEFIQKMNKYTSLDAKYDAKRIWSIAAAAAIAPIKTFFKLFCWQMGFLDGRIGFVTCYLFAIYNLVTKVKVWESQNL